MSRLRKGVILSSRRGKGCRSTLLGSQPHSGAIAVDATKRKRPDGAPKSLAIEGNYRITFKLTKLDEYSIPCKMRVAPPPNVPPQSNGAARIRNQFGER